MRRRRTERITRRLVRSLGALFLGLILGSGVLVAVVRWVDPPFSSYMAQMWVEQAMAGQWPRIEYRWTAYEAVSPHLRLAVVAAEDQKFPDHIGFDLQSIRQAIAERRGRGRLRGASTITQQVAKNLFLWHGRSMLRKGIEAWFALLIEVTWPKRRILEVYLNIAETGEGLFGVGAAAQRYFKRPASELAPHQAALIAAMLPNPRAYRPDAPSEYLRKRQDWILGQMRALGGPAFLDGL